MAGRIPTLGYPSRTAAVMALLDQGLTIEEIAERIGISVHNVQNLIYYRQKIPRQKDGQAIAIRLNERLNSALAELATRRGVQPAEIATKILSTVIEEDLVDAVLDDEQQEVAP